MKRAFAIFTLTESIDGINNNGLSYDNYTFTLSKYSDTIANNYEALVPIIKSQLIDYESRNLKPDNRFVIMEVFFMDSDNIF